MLMAFRIMGPHASLMSIRPPPPPPPPLISTTRIAPSQPPQKITSPEVSWAGLGADRTPQLHQQGHACILNTLSEFCALHSGLRHFRQTRLKQASTIGSVRQGTRMTLKAGHAAISRLIPMRQPADLF